MNQIIEASASQDRVTMSSRDIAGLVEKRHDHVKRDIENMLSQLGKDIPSFGGIYLDSRSREQVEYHLDRELTETLITGYSIALRHKVIVRLHELESRNAVTLPQSFAESLRLAADLAEKNDQLQLENKQQSTKIASLESLFKEGMTATQYCKALNGVNVMAVNAYLFGRHWLFNESKTSTRWRVACYARDTYMTEHQQQITPHGAEPFIQYTPVLLKKGAARLHELYLAGELPMKKTWDGSYTHIKQERSAA